MNVATLVTVNGDLAPSGTDDGSFTRLDLGRLVDIALGEPIPVLLGDVRVLLQELLRGGRGRARPPGSVLRDPLALQVALLIPLMAALLGLLNSFRMVRLPDPKPSEHAEAMALG